MYIPIKHRNVKYYRNRDYIEDHPRKMIGHSWNVANKMREFRIFMGALHSLAHLEIHSLTHLGTCAPRKSLTYAPGVSILYVNYQEIALSRIATKAPRNL